MKHLKLAGIALVAATLSSALWAQALDVKNAWARATVQGQKSSGAFMTLTAKDGGKLVSASSPVAGVVEVHEMKMEGDVMKMRAVPSLDLPAGKTVELKPGGYHVMLLDLKVALQKDTTIPMTLVFKDAKGVESKTELKVPVSVTAPAGASASDMHAGHGDQAAMEPPKGTDAEQIAATMKRQFDRPDAPLSVEPVSIVGNSAVAGWIQGTKGGRAFLQKDKGVWFISVCAGDGLKDPKVLLTTGLNAADAAKLAKAVAAAEWKLSKDKLKLFASFEGMIKIGADGHGAHEGHDGKSGHTAHDHSKM
jgi:periplasmic copper chaperone A